MTEKDFEERLFWLAVEAASGTKFFGHTEAEQARHNAVLTHGLKTFPGLSLSPERLASASEAGASIRRSLELTAELQK